MNRFDQLRRIFPTTGLAVTIAAQLVFFAPSTPAMQDGAVETSSTCDALYQTLRQTIEPGGVRNGGTFPVPGIPWFRTSRFLEEMRYFISDRNAWHFWLDRLAQQGRTALPGALEQLPHEALLPLMRQFGGEQQVRQDGTAARQAIGQMAERCLNRTWRRLKQAPPIESLFTGRPGIPDEYRMVRRIFGLYPLFAVPIGVAVSNYRREVADRYEIPLARLVLKGRLDRYTAAPLFTDLDAPTTAALLAEASRNPLGIPMLSQGQLAVLAHRFAPVLEPDVTGVYDIPGAVYWQDGLVAIDPERTTVYYYGSHAILHGRALLQLNYVLWYTERPRQHFFDIAAGRIDGLTLRLTLDTAGRPIMVDVIQNCGCYHFFFPSPRVFKAARMEPLREDAFVPQWLPPLSDETRLAVRIETRRHRVERLHRDHGSPEAPKTYELVPYERLESLPRDSGKIESIFTSNGLVKGKTERRERFFLFSVGIPQAGSMRQRGHHPTALIGRRTFDDPRLFEKFFSLQE